MCVARTAIAAAYSASFTQSAAEATPQASPVHANQDAADPNAPKKKPIRTYIGSKQRTQSEMHSCCL